MEDRLASVAGIRPSPEWLDACRQHLRGTGTGTPNHEEEDDVLYQIINTDLRNVVRRFENGNSNGNDNGSGNGNGNGNGSNTSASPDGMTTSVILRKAIQDSLPPPTSTNGTRSNGNVNVNVNVNVNGNSNSNGNSNGNGGGNNIIMQDIDASTMCEAILPSSFRCMIQIEELLDVSMNAETRLSLGPASRTAPAPIGNQKKRCLKMAVSDGYYDNGRTSRTNNNNNNSNNNNSGDDLNLYRGHIVAMEMEPIPNLSVHSKPGIKVIISGPITVRLGILTLHPGNTTVCGGCIPELIPIQRKAIDLAAKLAGVGIDPTVRALVWNPETGLEEGNDEGEQASEDVREPQSVNRHNVRNQHQNLQSSHSTNNHTRRIPQDATVMNTSSSSTMDGGRRAPLTTSSSSSSTRTVTSRNANSNGNSGTASTGTVRMNPYSQHSAQNNAPTSVSTSSSRPASSSRSRQNPYTTNSSSSLPSTSISASTTSHAPIQNPYQRSRGESTSKPQGVNTKTKTNSNTRSMTTPINTYKNGFTTASAMVGGNNGNGSNSLTPSNTTHRESRASLSGSSSISRSRSSNKPLNPYQTSKTPNTSIKTIYSAQTPVSSNGTSTINNPYKSGNARGQRKTNAVTILSSSSSSSSSSTNMNTNNTNRQNTSLTTRISQNQINPYQASTRKRNPIDNEQPSEKFVDLTSPEKDCLTPTNADLSQMSSSSASVSASATNANGFQKIQNLSPTSTALSEPLSFKELRHLLKKIIHDPDKYEKYEKKIFVVPCKMHPKQPRNNLGFTIEKNKDYKKKKSSGGSKPEKHMYLMMCQFTGTNSTDGKITCKIIHDVLKPYIPISASEMKKLVKEDKKNANKMANEIGSDIADELKKLATCHFKLLHPRSIFFDEKHNREIDGQNPILQLDVRGEGY